MIPYWKYNVKIYSISSKWKFAFDDINGRGNLKVFFINNMIIK